MKISYSWIKEYCNTNIQAEEVAQILTACGLEVEAIEKYEKVKGSLKGIVVGEVITKIKHPNADKLSLTTVNIGAENLLRIVCGAPNVEAGQKVLIATVGAVLFPSKGDLFEIKKSKIRGEDSEGMICAEDEIGIGESHAGIMILEPSAQIGTSAFSYFNLSEDLIFEIGLTPNRIDAASHIGVARDLCAAINAGSGKLAVQFPSVADFKIDNKNSEIKVLVEDSVACPRYTGISVSGITVSESPAWLQNRLKSIGVKPINNIVDIANFVMQECGQPLHAFDSDKIEGKKIIVKKLLADTKFTTLDGVERKLSADDLMICSSEKGMCMAGVFGGLHSGVSANTKNIFIESAYFNPSTIRRTSKRHALKTDAAFRYERGADPEMTLYALKRAALLMKEIGGGSISSDVIDIYPNPIHPVELNFSPERFQKLSGVEIEHSILRGILSDLDIKIDQVSKAEWILKIPSYRPDVKREADVTEEVLRIYGYDKIPLTQRLRAPLTNSQKPNREKIKNGIADLLCSNGFYEIFSNTLTNSSSVSIDSAVTIKNPLSEELSFMRQSLLPGGLSAISYNRNRKSQDLKFFEFGKTYERVQKGKTESTFNEVNRLALFLTGRKNPEKWNSDNAKVNFYLLKAFVEEVILKSGVKASLNYKAFENSALSNSLALSIKDVEIAMLGSVTPSVLKAADIVAEVYFAEINWDNLLSLIPVKNIEYSEVPRFPEVRRDLSMILDQHIAYSEIEQLALKSDSALLKSVNLFDVYQGDKIEKGKKSYAVSFILSDESHTLTDKEVDKLMDKLTEKFESVLGAVIRRS